MKSLKNVEVIAERVGWPYNRPFATVGHVTDNF